jgi:16S rRNA processing protein RimM
VKFVGYDTKEDAASLTNLVLKSTIEESNRACELDENEYFWYDIIGLDVCEGETLIGTVSEIERYPTEDHLLIETTENIQKEKKLKRFLLPFNDRTIESVNLAEKKITVTGALEIIDIIAS